MITDWNVWKQRGNEVLTIFNQRSDSLKLIDEGILANHQIFSVSLLTLQPYLQKQKTKQNKN